VSISNEEPKMAQKMKKTLQKSLKNRKKGTQIHFFPKTLFFKI